MTGGPTERFTDRVDHYVRSRPSYPPEALDALEADGTLRPGDVVVDLGCGTGILARSLLDRGHRVIGVEPNDAMRLAGARQLASEAGFAMIGGRAEATGLADRSVDLAVAGQALHWFDRPAARAEMSRILRPPGRLAVLWNDRAPDASPATAAYEALLVRHGTDFRRVDHRRLTDEEIAAFFSPDTWRVRRFANFQDLDLEGLRARLLSTSYVPAAGDPAAEPMLADLEELFRRHQRDGRVRLVYETRVFSGNLAG